MRASAGTWTLQSDRITDMRDMVLPRETDNTKHPGCGYGTKRVSHAFEGVYVLENKGMMQLLHGFTARFSAQFRP